jgi:hypothetical protein
MDKEKYHVYLASREWALKKEAVKDRSGGICERCMNNKSEAVHHLSYQHIYDEPLEDLLDVCGACHEYLSGKSNIDPSTSDYNDALGCTRKMFLSTHAGSEEEQKKIMVCCPVCGYEYLHFEKPDLFSGNDNGDAGWTGRGNKISILFWCENSHAFRLCFGFHKGNTFFFLQPANEEDKKRVFNI